VGVSKPKYNIKESPSHVWLSFMLYFGLLTPTFDFPLSYILVYLLPRLTFLYAIFWFTYSHVWLSFMLYSGLLTPTFNVGVSKPKYSIKESQTWEEVNQNIT
jgi:hypothetical protein